MPGAFPRSHQTGIRPRGDLVVLAQRQQGQPGELDEAAALLADAFAICDRLRGQHPGNNIFVSRYYSQCEAQALLLEAQGKPAEGLIFLIQGYEARADFDLAARARYELARLGVRVSFRRRRESARDERRGASSL